MKTFTKHRFTNISQLLFHFSNAERYNTHPSDITYDIAEKNTSQAALVEKSTLVVLNLWLYMTAILILYSVPCDYSKRVEAVPLDDGCLE